MSGFQVRTTRDTGRGSRRRLNETNFGLTDFYVCSMKIELDWKNCVFYERKTDNFMWWWGTHALITYDKLQISLDISCWPVVTLLSPTTENLHHFGCDRMWYWVAPNSLRYLSSLLSLMHLKRKWGIHQGTHNRVCYRYTSCSWDVYYKLKTSKKKSPNSLPKNIPNVDITKNHSNSSQEHVGK